MYSQISFRWFQQGLEAPRCSKIQYGPKFIEALEARGCEHMKPSCIFVFCMLSATMLSDYSLGPKTTN